MMTLREIAFLALGYVAGAVAEALMSGSFRKHYSRSDRRADDTQKE
jgi:hypothetical protein